MKKNCVFEEKNPENISFISTMNSFRNISFWVGYLNVYRVRLGKRLLMNF